MLHGHGWGSEGSDDTLTRVTGDGVCAAAEEGVAEAGDADVHRVRGGEGTLGLELHGALGGGAAMGEPHLREPVSGEGHNRRSSEQERGRERRQKHQGFQHHQHPTREPGGNPCAASARERRARGRAHEGER